jgi:hypothetical protein
LYSLNIWRVIMHRCGQIQILTQVCHRVHHVVCVQSDSLNAIFNACISYSHTFYRLRSKLWSVCKRMKVCMRCELCVALTQLIFQSNTWITSATYISDQILQKVFKEEHREEVNLRKGLICYLSLFHWMQESPHVVLRN